jgi:hypothetical protein
MCAHQAELTRRRKGDKQKGNLERIMSGMSAAPRHSVFERCVRLNSWKS